MRLQRRMQHPIDRGIVAQKCQHRRRVCHVPLHAQRQRLDALQQLERVHRRQAGAEVAQAFGPGAHDEGGGAELLGKDNAVITRIRLGHRREFARSLPVETPAVDDRAADGDAVSADPFGDRVHDDVGAKRERAAQIGRGKGVVDQERNAGRMRDLGHLRDVEHFQSRIADGFTDHQPGAVVDAGADAVEIARLDEARGDAEARQRVGQEIDRAAIERSRRDDMIAGAQQRGDGKMHRRHAACGAHGADAVFERRKPLFQHRRRRIGNPRVDVAGALQIEQTGRVIGIVEHVRGGLIDRDGARTCHRIGMLAGMQAQGLEGGRFRRGHELVTSLGR